MGKKSRSRDNTPISSPRLHAETPFLSFSDSLAQLAMSNQDLRTLRSQIYPTMPVAADGRNSVISYNYHRKPRMLRTKQSTAYHAGNPYTRTFSPSTPAFERPRLSLVCARRNIRRQIMFALQRRRMGRGASFRKPRYNQFSSVRC